MGVIKIITTQTDRNFSWSFYQLQSNLEKVNDVEEFIDDWRAEQEPRYETGIFSPPGEGNRLYRP